MTPHDRERLRASIEALRVPVPSCAALELGFNRALDAVLALLAAGDGQTPAIERFICPTCDVTRADEEGCCATCGADTTVQQRPVCRECLGIGVAPDVPEGEAQFAWVIEGTHVPPPNWRDSGYSVTGPFPPKYWTSPDRERSLDAWGDHQHAVRFARREDAERVIRREGLQSVGRAIKHGWTAPDVPEGEAPAPKENKMLTPAQAVAVLMRDQMKGAGNYVRSDSGVLKFTILAAHLNILLSAVEA